jgi:hypothetical protein
VKEDLRRRLQSLPSSLECTLALLDRERARVVFHHLGLGKFVATADRNNFFLFFRERLLPDASFNAEHPMKIERLQSPLSALVLVFPSNMVS